MSGRSPEEREQARRDREIRRLERAGEPVPPELREPVRPATPPPPIAGPSPASQSPQTPAPAPEEPAPPHDTGAHDAPRDTGEHEIHEDTGDHEVWDETGEHPVYHETGEHEIDPLQAPALAPGYATATAAAASATPAPKRKGVRRRWAIGLLAVAGVFIVFLAWFAVQLFQPFDDAATGARTTVKIPEGSSTADVADILAKAKVVDSAFFFELRARLDGANLRSGTYTTRTQAPYGDVITLLSTPPTAAKTVTISIPEGLSRREIAPRVKDAGLKGNYVSATKRSARLSPRRYGAPRGTRSLEGFLFPSTYELKRKASVRRLVDEQLATFKKNIATVDLAYAKKKNLTVYDILIIASMIDREAAVEGDRAKIAAVIYNRLKAKIPLGIDATTRYQFNNWQTPITASQLQSASGYNTRKNQGLPPTPIGNPGLASIRAAANPSRRDYLFFVVKPCGNGAHVFSSTNAQFLKDEAAYNAARDKNGGKDPSRCKN